MANYSVLFLDPGGEYYYSAGLTAVGVWNGGANGNLSNSAPAGRATAYAIASNNGFVRNTGNYASWCIGWAMYQPSWANSAYLNLLDNGTGQVDLRTNTVGQFYFTRNGTQIGSLSTFQGVINSWHYYEVQVVIASGTSGSATLYVDGVAQLTVTGVNTQATANAYAQQVKFFCQNGGCYFKDIYIMADTGTGPHTTRLGDVTVPVVYPNAAGVNQQWTLGAGSSQTAAVQDGITHSGTWPDGDTSYIDSATAGQISDFAHPALSLTGSIYAVMIASYCRKDDAGSRSFANVCLSGGTESDGTTNSLGNTYQYYMDVYENDPHTSAPWTLSGFNNATWGVKCIS